MQPARGAKTTVISMCATQHAEESVEHDIVFRSLFTRSRVSHHARDVIYRVRSTLRYGRTVRVIKLPSS